MPDVVLRTENLGKKYLLSHESHAGGYDTLREKISARAASAMRRLRSGSAPRVQPSFEEFWALRAVSLTVQQGDVLGIVGRNGSGKSTLLKVISRITEPTEGSVTIRGRVASLLEVGTGFHPELTGRENIFLNGAILGMTRGEMRRKFDEIVAFAEVERFLDTPVKRYSSGMYVRLAFAVAAHLEPEILIVDEVLAVGDVAFQKKCLGRMNDVAHEGRTVIVVSHNMLSIEALCTRAVWLHGGHLMHAGAPREVISRYLGTAVSALAERFWPDLASAPGNDDVRLHCARARPVDALPGDPITVCTPFVLEFEFWNLRPETRLNAVIQLHNEHGILIFESAPAEHSPWFGQAFPAGLFRMGCHVPANLLNAGVHDVTLILAKNQDVMLHMEKDILVFDVVDSVQHRAGWYGTWPGAVRPMLEWETDQLDGDPARDVRSGQSSSA